MGDCNLKHCPFCGANNQILDEIESFGHKAYRYVCKDCSARKDYCIALNRSEEAFKFAKIQAVKVWNERKKK
jgi:Lar family restriction alleviation protein